MPHLVFFPRTVLALRSSFLYPNLQSTMPSNSSLKEYTPATRRAHRRQRQKRQVQMLTRFEKRRQLRESLDDETDRCFELCHERGMHLDPEIRIGSSANVNGMTPRVLLTMVIAEL